MSLLKLKKKKKTYNLIFSLGAACSCSICLRKGNLQFASYPLDWILGCDLKGKIDILTYHFRRFFKKSDLSYVFPIKILRKNLRKKYHV